MFQPSYSNCFTVKDWIDLHYYAVHASIALYRFYHKLNELPSGKIIILWLSCKMSSSKQYFRKNYCLLDHIHILKGLCNEIKS